jgi:transketolase
VLGVRGISARVVNIHTIKPLDREIIRKAALETGAIVVAEEHNVIGGLGSAVAECVAETCPCPVMRVGVQDTFGRSGKVPPLLDLYGLNSETIIAKAEAALRLKKAMKG